MSPEWTRREVNISLLAGAFGALAGRGAGTRAASTVLFDSALAGAWYYALPKLRDRLQTGERLLLRPEPDNPFDNNAVAVHHSEGAKLGFVPRRANAPVVDLLAQGRRVEAEVAGTLRVLRTRDISDALVFTSFSDGDPRLRLLLVG